MSEQQYAESGSAPSSPRWLRLRYWLIGSVLVVLVLLTASVRTWYRHHQMIHELFGGYGYHSSGGQVGGFPDTPFIVDGPLWIRSALESDISPFDCLKSVYLYFPDALADPRVKLRLLAQERELRDVRIAFEQDASADDSLFEYFKDLRQLEKLTAETISLPGDGLKHLKQATDLTSLELKLAGPISGLNVLRELKSLETLKLDLAAAFSTDAAPNVSSEIAANSARALSHLERLRVLHLRGWKVGPEAFEALTTNPSLVEVRLEGGQLDSHCVAWLARIPKLQKLYLSPSFWPLEPGMFAALQGSNIEELGLYGIPDETSIADLFRGVETLPKLKILKGFLPKNSADIALCARCFPELTWLRLRSTKPNRSFRYPGDWEPPLRTSSAKITDDDVKLLATLQHLEQLELGANPITDEAVEFLGQMKSLKEIDVSQTDITPAGRAKFTQLLPAVRLGFSVHER